MKHRIQWLCLLAVADAAGGEGGQASPEVGSSPYAALGDAVLTAALSFEGHSTGERSPASLGITVPVTGQREFLVQGRIREGTQALQLRLRIMLPDGAAPSVHVALPDGSFPAYVL